MRTPPSIPIPVITAAVYDAYAIEAPVLTFVRGGEKAWNFNVASSSGAYRLKIYADSSDIDKRLAAIYHLHHNYKISPVVAPLMLRDGGFTFDIGGMRATLFPYIFATTASGTKRLSDAQSAELGRVLARIHAVSCADITLPAADFSAEAADRVEDVLAWLSEPASPVLQSNPIPAGMLLSIEDRLREEIKILRAATLDVQHSDLPRVICHGNLSIENILVGDGVYIVDWESVYFAAKEMDLMYFAGHDSVWYGYAEAGGNTILDEAALRYYRARRNNTIVADYATRILFQNQSVMQHDHDIAQLRNFLRSSGLGGDKI